MPRFDLCVFPQQRRKSTRLSEILQLDQESCLFIGQRRVVQILESNVEGARLRGQVLPNLLLVGGPGMGKTSLAECLAKAFEVALHRIDATSKTTPEDIYSVLRGVEHGDVVFVDEIHALEEKTQLAFYRPIEDRVLPTGAEKGAKEGEAIENIADFCLIGATDSPGRLKSALLSRLNPMPFEPYSSAEMATILRCVGARPENNFGLDLTGQAANSLARCCRTPRQARQLLELLSNMLAANGERTGKVGVDAVATFFAAHGIDEEGLFPLHRRYLRHLASAPSGSAKLIHLANWLGLDQRYVQLQIESDLLARQLIDVHSHARVITGAGRRIAGAEDPPIDAAAVPAAEAM